MKSRKSQGETTFRHSSSGGPSVPPDLHIIDPTLLSILHFSNRKNLFDIA